MTASKEELKQQLHAACTAHIAGQLSNLQVALKSAQDSGNDETKSTTGDKHETGRAMMQMEQEKIGRQLAELEKMKMVLERIPATLNEGKIRPGNVVVTDRGNFYIALAAGKIAAGDAEYVAISAASPVALAMLNRAAGEAFVFNGNTYRIIATF